MQSFELFVCYCGGASGIAAALQKLMAFHQVNHIITTTSHIPHFDWSVLIFNFSYIRWTITVY